MSDYSSTYQSGFNPFRENSDGSDKNPKSTKTESTSENGDPNVEQNRQNESASDSNNKTAIQYCRTSSEPDDDDRTGSIEAQESQTRNSIDYYDFETFDVWISDKNVSGQDLDREGIEKLHDKLEAYDIEYVAVSDISRIGRDSIQVPAFIEKIYKEYGTKVLCDRDIMDVSKPKDRQLINMQAITAEAGVEYQAFQAKAVRKDRLHEEHNWQSWFNNVPFGYTPSENQWIHQIENRKALINTIHDTFQNAPITNPYAETRDYINENFQEEFPMKYNGENIDELTTKIIRDIVTNPVYAGLPTTNFDYKTSPPVEEVNKKQHDDLSFVSLEKYKKSRKQAMKCWDYNSSSFGENNNAEDLVQRHGVDALEILDRITLKCDECSNGDRYAVMRKDGGTHYGGRQRQLYECPSCENQTTFPHDDEFEKIENLRD